MKGAGPRHLTRCPPRTQEPRTIFSHDLSVDFLQEIAHNAAVPPGSHKYKNTILIITEQFYFPPDEKDSRRKLLLPSYFYMQINFKSVSRDNTSRLEVFNLFLRRSTSQVCWGALGTLPLSQWRDSVLGLLRPAVFLSRTGELAATLGAEALSVPGLLGHDRHQEVPQWPLPLLLTQCLLVLRRGAPMSRCLGSSRWPGGRGLHALGTWRLPCGSGC